MTPDQKRAHLALHGFIAVRRIEFGGSSDAAGPFRIVRFPRVVRSTKGLYAPSVERWRWTRWTVALMGGFDNYCEISFREIPDDDLNALDLDLLAQI